MNIGLVCISEILKSQNKQHAFQTMTRSRFNALGRHQAIAQLSSRIKHNASLCSLIINHCHAVGIKHYRISSNLFPLITDESLGLCYADLPDFDQIKDILAQAGDNARRLGISLSSHPDQFNVLPSLNQDTVRRTIAELNHQAYVLDLFGCPQDYSAPMCLHLNLSFDSDKETIVEYVARFSRAFHHCVAGVRQRLVLENEHGGYWNCSNLFEHFGDKFPLVFDNLHNDINQSRWTAQECFEKFYSTWGKYTPVFHWSEGCKDKPRSHADYFTHIPSVYKSQNVILECEVKAKDKAILQVLKGEIK
jgi:UV DNA damage endonuclease